MLKAKSAVMAGLALAGVLATGAAQADVVYTFAGTASYHTPDTGLYGPFFSLSYDLTDAQVASGAFTLATALPVINIQDYSATFTGDASGFVSLNLNGDVARPGYSQAVFSTSLTFDAAGNVTSSSLTSRGISSDIDLTGSGDVVSGTFGSDRFQACELTPSASCSFSGTLTRTASAVPEPATFAVLGVGLVGLVVSRRRAA